jgi:hypothetical protein
MPPLMVVNGTKDPIRTGLSSATLQAKFPFGEPLVTATGCGFEPKGSGCCDKLEIKGVAAAGTRARPNRRKTRKGKRSFLHLTMIPYFVIWLRREIGKKQRVTVSNRKGIANQTGPESCVAHGEVRDEALTGEPAGQPWSRESRKLVQGQPTCRSARLEKPECISRLAEPSLPGNSNK